MSKFKQALKQLSNFSNIFKSNIFKTNANIDTTFNKTIFSKNNEFINTYNNSDIYSQYGFDQVINENIPISNQETAFNPIQNQFSISNYLNSVLNYNSNNINDSTKTPDKSFDTSLNNELKEHNTDSVQTQDSFQQEETIHSHRIDKHNNNSDNTYLCDEIDQQEWQQQITNLSNTSKITKQIRKIPQYNFSKKNAPEKVIVEQKSEMDANNNDTSSSGFKNFLHVPWTHKAACFVDYSAYPTPDINKYSEASGLKCYFVGHIGVADVNGKSTACWNGEEYIHDSHIKSIYSSDVTYTDFIKTDISIFRKNNGDAVLSFGGNLTFLEEGIKENNLIFSIYNKALKNYNATALNFNLCKDFMKDSLVVDRHIEVVKDVQLKNYEIKLSYTLNVGDYYSITGGIDEESKLFLQKLHDAGMCPSLINGLTDRVQSIQGMNSFNAIQKICKVMHKDISSIYHELSPQEIWSVMGICPVFGKNLEGGIFTIEDQKKLVAWANEVDLGCLNGFNANIDHDNFQKLDNYKSGEFCSILSSYDLERNEVDIIGEEFNNEA